MSSTYSSLHYHVVFSTKGREPWIASSWRGRLHEYLGGTVGGLNATPIIVGGVNDHVHLLVTLRPVHCPADFVREVKKASSVWVHQEIRRAEFAWQEGYAALTVSPSGRDRVRDYIARQEDHHRKRSFREELVEMLDRTGVSYDSRYVG
ncbi:IS200/IS605 family transposase [soil metagenome]